MTTEPTFHGSALRGSVKLDVTHFDGDLFLTNVHVGVASSIVGLHAQLTLRFSNETGNLLKQELVKAVNLHAHESFVFEIQLDDVPRVGLRRDGNERSIFLSVKLRSIHIEKMLRKEHWQIQFLGDRQKYTFASISHSKINGV